MREKIEQISNDILELGGDQIDLIYKWAIGTLCSSRLGLLAGVITRLSAVAPRSQTPLACYSLIVGESGSGKTVTGCLVDDVIAETDQWELPSTFGFASAGVFSQPNSTFHLHSQYASEVVCNKRVAAGLVSAWRGELLHRVSLWAEMITVPKNTRDVFPRSGSPLSEVFLVLTPHDKIDQLKHLEYRLDTGDRDYVKPPKLQLNHDWSNDVPEFPKRFFNAKIDPLTLEIRRRVATIVGWIRGHPGQIDTNDLLIAELLQEYSALNKRSLK